MANVQPTEIQLHLTTGLKRNFYQQNAELVNRICGDLDGQIFSRPCIIIDGKNEVTVFPGHAIVGITIRTFPFPACYRQQEDTPRSIITEISRDDFMVKHLESALKGESEMNITLSDVEFITGTHVYLQSGETTPGGSDDKNALNDLFTGGSLSCRRMDAGFSIWNTAHIVSWSHYPKLKVPDNAWPAELLIEVMSDDYGQVETM